MSIQLYLQASGFAKLADYMSQYELQAHLFPFIVHRIMDSKEELKREKLKIQAHLSDCAADDAAVFETLTEKVLILDRLICQ